jgi:hypothetical protein
MEVVCFLAIDGGGVFSPFLAIGRTSMKLRAMSPVFHQM